MFDEVNGLPGFAAETHQNVRGHIGVFGEPGQRPVELIMVGAVVLHRATGFVSDGHHAVDVGIVLQ